jgi:tape measure domain-containing protein
MATEVGALNASLTLDLSNFRAGMSEAASMAAELGMQLQSAFSSDIGFSRMTAEVLELLAQVGNLSAAMEDFKASMARVSGADMFAQMRTYTAALPSEIASISRALDAADLAAIQLGLTLQEIAIAATSAAAASQGLAGVGTSSIDFGDSAAQIQQMTASMSEFIAMMQKIKTLDFSTGEIVGDDQSMPVLFNMMQMFQQIADKVQSIAVAIKECTIATAEWAKVVRQVSTMFGTVSSSIRQANTAAKGVGTSMKGAEKGAKSFVGQTDKAAKSLQTSKGYAVSVKGILGGIVISQAFYQLLNIMEELVRSAILFSETLQDASVAFEYLFQDSTTSAEAFLNALKNIALQSPLDTTDLASASRKLMAMGFSAQATVPTLQILTDTAAVFSNSAADMSDQIDHIALAFGQMIASGKVSAQELRQLYNAGLPIYDLLSDGLGITKEMAKNIGHYNIDSASAVFAVLQELQKRYSGAAVAMSTTFSGSMGVIRESLQQIISYSWAGIFDTLTAKLGNVSKFLRALVKITQAYGIGGLFQAIFPESSWDTIRNLIGGLKMLGAALKQVGQIFLSSFGGGLKILAQVGSYVLPIIGNLANVLLTLARTALAASPALRLLLSVIAALIIGSLVAKVVVFLSKAIWLLTGAKAAAKMIGALISSIITLGAVNKVAVIAVLALAAAFLAVIASSAKARAAIASFFGTLRGAVNTFAEGLGLGFDPGEIAMPEFDPPDLSDFSAGIENMTDGMDKLKEATDGAGKSAKKNLQAFDEVFTIDNDAGGGGEDALGGLWDSLSGMGDLSYSDLFDWTGDWATDWGNLSAGLDGLGDLASITFGDLGTAIKDFWDALTGGNSELGLAAIDAIALALALLGNLKWAGALKVIEGVVEIVAAVKDMLDEGINFDNVMDVIHGLTNVAIGIGLFVGNIKIVGWGLAIQGFTEIIRELADNWEAIREGDWSGVSAVTLIVGGLKILGGLILALATFSAISKTAKGASTAADTVNKTADATKAVDVAHGRLSPTLSSLAKNLGMGLVILAEIAAAALLMIGAVWLMGTMLEQVGLAWQPVIDNGGTIATVMGIGVGLLATIGVITALLGSVGTTLIVNIALGTAILAELGLATGLFLAEIWIIGLLLQQIGEAWQPVLDNGETIASAIGLGTALLLAIGVVTAALGMATVATAGLLPLAIGLGTAILLELGVAAALFASEIIVVGLLLQDVGAAWQPVLDNGETIAAGIEAGTVLLIAVGAACAALGVATVASAGLLPLAIGLGTAILVEMAAACIALVDSMSAVADELTGRLAPSLDRLNDILPGLIKNMDAFIAFMTDFADSVASYTESMGDLTWSSIVNSFLKIFSSSPIGDLAADVAGIAGDVKTLNDKLKIAVPELETAVDLLNDYQSLMNQLRLLTEANNNTELASGMFTNLKAIGENLVTGLTVGITDKTDEAVRATQRLGEYTVEGVRTGMNSHVSTVYTWITNFAKDLKTKFNTAFQVSGNTSSLTQPTGKAILQGLLDGIKVAAGNLGSGLTTNVLSPIKTWAYSNMTTSTLYSYGEYLMQGFQNGIYSMRYSVYNTVTEVMNRVKKTIKDVFDIHSPSGVTTEMGQYLDEGLIVGMQSGAKRLNDTAANLANSVVDSLSTNKVVMAPTVSLSNVTGTALTSLQDWSTKFVSIVTDTFAQITSLFDDLNARLATSMAGPGNFTVTLTAPTGSIAAADQLGPALSTSTTGASSVYSVLADLTENAIEGLSSRVAIHIYEYLAPLFATMGSADQSAVIAYVGTLIADERGLKELQRKLQVIQLEENTRRGRS